MRFVKEVLQVIPLKIFNLLEEIAVILSVKIGELETKVNKDHLKDHALLDDRFQLAKLTHEVTIFTEGMLCLD